MALPNFFDFLRRSRRELDDVLARRGLAHTFSLARARLHALSQLVADHAQGDCLDAGSGRSPYKCLLQQYGSRVLSVDVEDRCGQLDLVADLQEMPQVATESMQTILCTQVLDLGAHPAAMERHARASPRPETGRMLDP
jgi:hypothetical protein